MEETDRQALREAKALLENPGLAARLVNVVGRPIEEGIKYLPERARNQTSTLTRKALLGSLQVALSTVNGSSGWRSSRLTNKLGAAAAGGVGGFFGMPGLAVELPVSTTIMMRAIATIARENGEDTESPETRMACIEVFALGGPSESDDGTETGYYAVRAAMAKVVGDAIAFLTKQGGTLAGRQAPAIVRLIARVAERFSIQVTEKAAAQALPVVSAASAAAVNLLFIDHYQDMATGHFTVRRLERKYGPDTVKTIYAALPSRAG